MSRLIRTSLLLLVTVFSEPVSSASRPAVTGYGGAVVSAEGSFEEEHAPVTVASVATSNQARSLRDGFVGFLMWQPWSIAAPAPMGDLPHAHGGIGSNPWWLQRYTCRTALVVATAASHDGWRPPSRERSRNGERVQGHRDRRYQ